MHARHFLLAALLFLIASTAAAQDDRDATALATRARQLDSIVTILDRQIALKSVELPKEQRAELDAQTTWIGSVRDRVAALARELRTRLKDSTNGGSMVADMAKMNLQFLALQEAVQQESRKFQTLSNASKKRHDVVVATIRNMK